LDGSYAAGAPIRLVPLAGIVLGVAAAAIYWLASQVWPSSIAVVLAMLATSPVTAPAGRAAGPGGGTGPGGAVQQVFFLLIKYNALLALSAAKLPFALPEHLTLGLIMVAGQAASRALVVSRVATDLQAATRVTTPDLVIALLQGAAPGLLLGIPGLIGLAAALGIRLAQGAIRPDPPAEPADRSAGQPARLEFTQQLAEISFYLGALAAWRYV
jgi:adenosylcobinamide-GDP ribazoletransferase